MAQTDMGLITALIGCTIAIVGTVIAMMFWVRSESNGLRAEAKEDRKDFLQICRTLELAIVSIQQETKEFHAQLYSMKKDK